jgi:hypothetical protein
MAKKGLPFERHAALVPVGLHTFIFTALTADTSVTIVILMDWDEDIYEDLEEEESKYLIVSVEKNSFAISEENVVELMIKPELTELPDSPAWNPGVIPLRDELIPLIELRAKTGYPTKKQEQSELLEILERYENDHRKWLDTLYESIEEGTDFPLALDPRECDFGSWYYSYSTSNVHLDLTLKKIERPHRLLHEASQKALEIRTIEGGKAALDFMESKKKREFNTILKLFYEAKEIVREQNREIAVILQLKSKIALAVDEVDSFVPLDLGDSQNTKLIHGLQLGRDPRNESVYPILSEDWLQASEVVSNFLGT